MTSSLAGLTTAELIGIIARAATELERRADSPPHAQAAEEAPSSPSPVVPRQCNYCGGRILLATTEKSGQWIPVDEKEGNFILVNGRARWVNGGGTHAFHYDSCPGSVQNQPAEPTASLFYELTEELGLQAPSIESPTAGGDAKDDM